ncbi:unnamed protein product [Rangifer tarandus platyrhynchus]|uniref:Basic proline-rich protein-like n=1 Tax=Rangifer tarandus platyrhynchus TaxID=3082113 RepID=A0ABN9A7S4_RANTA|nr:unnamed protein product [Rangifer tarandus platyrhynchus]
MEASRLRLARQERSSTPPPGVAARSSCRGGERRRRPARRPGQQVRPWACSPTALPPHAPTPHGVSHHLKAQRATPLAGIPDPRFPTYWPRAGWSRKSFWERKGRKTTPPIPDPDGHRRTRGAERKRAPPGPQRGPTPAATLRRGVPGVIPDSPPKPSVCCRSARTAGAPSPTAQHPSVPGGHRTRPQPGRPRARALTRRRFGVAARARGESGGRDAVLPGRRPLSARPGVRPLRLRPLPRAAVVTPAPRPPPANPEAALGRPHSARARPPSATPASRPAPLGPGEGEKFAVGGAGRAPPATPGAPRHPRALRASRAPGLAARGGGRAPPRAWGPARGREGADLLRGYG